MNMNFEVHEIPMESHVNFKPLSERLSSFEQWGMIKAYCHLYNQVNDYVSERKIKDTCVWNGNELYNVNFQITNDKAVTRMWLTQTRILMLEICYDDFDKKNRLFRCD